MTEMQDARVRKLEERVTALEAQLADVIATPPVIVLGPSEHHVHTEAELQEMAELRERLRAAYAGISPVAVLTTAESRV